MTSEPEVEEFMAVFRELWQIAKVAENGNQSLSGSNRYAERFHRGLLGLAPLEGKFLRTLEALDPKQIDTAVDALALVKSESKVGTKRKAAIRQLELIAHETVLPGIREKQGPPAPVGEPVLPKAVVIPCAKAGKSYFINVVVQANASYEARCWDCCSVMIRKLAEELIVEAYEFAKREAEIKNAKGDFFMLSDLIDAILGAPHWNLGRETKATLPKLKALGDRSAHTRRYLATKSDIDDVLKGLRVVVDELLHLAGLK